MKLLAAALQKVSGIRPMASRARGKAWIIWLAAALLLMVLGGTLWRTRTGTRFVIDGVWIAEMRRANQTPFRVRLELVEQAGKLIGSVTYPTGEATVQGGTLEGKRMAFFTVHTPQFETESATFHWTGVVDGDQIRFNAADDNGVISGTAHRSP